MGVALLSAACLLFGYRQSVVSAPRRVPAAMNVFFAVTIGTMALGHLLAVTTKLALRTLEGPVEVFYVIGIALATPSWWLIRHTWRMSASDEDHRRATLGLNVWLVITLLALGLHNLPLAALGLLNMGGISCIRVGWWVGRL